MNKNYVLDTNVLLDNEKCIEILRSEGENKIFIPATVLEELDNLKKVSSKRHQVMRAIKAIINNSDNIEIISNGVKHDSNDNDILKEIVCNEDKVTDPIFVTNDSLLRFKAEKKGVKSEEFKDSNPFKSESQRYTGFCDPYTEELEKNCFFWNEGKLTFNNQYNEKKLIDYDNVVWKVKPKTPYQNAALELILSDHIDILSIQSEAGFGKTYITLAAMLHMILEQKRYKKAYIFKANIEIGKELGFLPGTMDEKMQPYFRPIKDLLEKLHEIRPANRVWKDPDAVDLQLNHRTIELLPLNYIRGMNIDDAIVLIDEVQNLSRDELRSVLSRMGDNVKCICTGDVRQIDNVHLNQENNGLNWMVRLFKGANNYGHVVLSGSKSRGPIADLVRESGL